VDTCNPLDGNASSTYTYSGFVDASNIAFPHLLARHSFLLTDNSLVLQITLVSDNYKWKVSSLLHINLIIKLRRLHQRDDL
jgi:hypothetical protein